ncbi:MAG TPA: hypothetical protein VIC56_09980 [Gemmatimonadota bacterium]
MSDHIPDPGQHRTLFYGAYSNRARGAAHYQHSINRILEHLDLRSPQKDRPPPAREILSVAEQGEGWGVPADWS